MESKPTITLAGKVLEVTLPGDFCTREELVIALGQSHGKTTSRRACAAIIGLCTRVGRMAKADYAAHGSDPLRYGGPVYDWLHGQGVSWDEILTATAVLADLLQEAAFPSDAEVTAATRPSSPPLG